MATFWKCDNSVGANEISSVKLLISVKYFIFFNAF